MSAGGGELLEVVAASAAAAGAAASGLAARALWTRLRQTAAALRPQAGAMPHIVLLAALNERCLPPPLLGALERFIRRSGSPREARAAELLATMELLGVACLAGGSLLAALSGTSAAVPVLVALAGGALPLLRIRDRVRARHRGIVRALPYAIDLLTLSVEAGLDFTAALAKVVEKGRRGPLRDELSVALKELRLGKTREEALRDLSRRLAVPGLTSFVQALVHSDRMGTPLGKVLRVLSTQMRVERTQRAEKLANEAPVKLLLPLVLCIFPTLFLMLFGPIGYQVFLGEGF